MQSPASSSLMPNGNGWSRYCRASRPPPGRLGFDNRKTVEGILGLPEPARRGAAGRRTSAKGMLFTSVSAAG